jgi:WD40 repeat protein/serine/threonine protein kinase
MATQRAQALLFYLAVESALGTPSHRREKLIELLWPGMPPSSGRKNLRQTLYYLRQTIPNRATNGDDLTFLISDRYKVEINPDYPLWLDLAAFLQRLDGPQAGWPEAIGLYRGDFLSDFSLEDSSEFEAWILGRRAYFRRRALDTLSTLTDNAIQRREYDQARDYAGRQLDLDDLREGAHRQMMELLALDGRRDEALAQYETCRRLLEEALGMAPSFRTTDLFRRIQSGDAALDAPMVPSARGYELREQIGKGAYGVVYRAIQPGVKREVAVKVIRRRYADDPQFIRRFESEAQTVAHLEHPYIVPLYDYWRDPDGAYLVMRYLRGGNLLTALEDGPLEPDRALKMLEQLAKALSNAHRQGVIHRDIKPANILLDEADNAFLSDFGIAKVLAEERDLVVEESLIGTPEYISPEQIRNEPIGPPSDIYSLGILLYEIVTGEKPFPGLHDAGLIHKQLNDPIPLVADKLSSLPVQVDDVIQKATAKRPADRFADALELAEAFRLALRGQELDSAIAVLPKADIPNPYKGLRAFQQADADDFFGRRALVQQLLARLAESPFLAVVGPSGSGKSSAVKAGLIPALRGGALPGSERWFVAEMVPGAYPLDELEKALWPVAVDPPPSLVEPMRRDSKGILRTVRRILPADGETNLLLVIDQFEELFTLVGDDRRRDHFIESLLEALNEPDSPLRVVVTLRADFYDRPLQQQALGRLLKANTEIVLPLSKEELAAAIVQPARQAGVLLEEDLTPAIVADVQTEPGALPLLQYALTELFERRQDGTMSLAAYEDVGGVTGALARRAEELYASLDPVSQDVARQIFLRLVTLGEGVEDTRRRVPRKEFDNLLISNDKQGADSESKVSHILDDFSRYRLLTFDRDPVTRNPTVEVAHEALLREWPRLRGWLEEGRDDIHLQRLLASAAAEWQGAGQEEGYLLHGARLSYYGSWAADSGVTLTSQERTFLEASLSARREREAAEAAQQAREDALEKRSRNILRYLVGVLAAATVVAIILVIFAFAQQRTAQQERDNAQEAAEARATQQAIAVQERTEAERQAQLAFSRELAAAALNDLDVDPERSILLGLEALSAAHTLQAENVLHEAIQHSRVRQTFDVGPDLWGVAFSPDGRYVATGDQDGVTIIWDVATGEAITTLTGHTASVRGVAYNNDGDLLATAGDDNVRVWNPTTGQELFTVDHTQGAFSVDFSPDGRLLATSNYDNTAKLWDVEASLAAGSGQEIHDLSGHTDWLWNVNFSADGSRVATTSSDGTAKIWDAASGEETLNLQVWENPEAAVYVESAIFSTDGERIVTVGGTVGESELSVWDAATGERLYELTGHSGNIMNVKLSPDGSLLATVGIDGTANLWDFSGGNRQPLFTLSGHTNWITDVAFSPDGKSLVTAARDGTARLWDISITGNQELLNYAGHSDWLRSVSFSPDESWLATASFDGTAQIWDGSSGEILLTLAGHDAAVNAVAFGPDGTRLATVSEDNTARLWDTTTGKQLHVLDGHTEKKYQEGGEPEGVMDVAFSPDGAKLATAGMDGQIKVWDVGTGEELLSLSGHPEDRGIYSVAFSQDGALLASGTDQPSVVKVWDTVTGRELLNLPGYEAGRIFGIDFNPDGSRLAVSNNTGQLDVWLLPEPKGDQSEQTPKKLHSNPSPHSSGITDVMFSSDGTRLVTASFDQTAKVWDAETGQALLTLNHPDGLWDARFSPDGTRLATAGLDGVARLFTVDLDELVELAKTRVTRSLTTAECQQYLHLETCPGGE